MAKFFGKIGFAKMTETTTGVWKEIVSEKQYYGDVISHTRRWEKGEWLNDNLNVNNKFSIVADNYIYENLGYMRYIEWMGTKWKISSFEVERPRLILTVGGVYNGQTA